MKVEKWWNNEKLQQINIGQRSQIDTSGHLVFELGDRLRTLSWVEKAYHIADNALLLEFGDRDKYIFTFDESDDYKTLFARSLKAEIFSKQNLYIPRDCVEDIFSKIL